MSIHDNGFVYLRSVASFQTRIKKPRRMVTRRGPVDPIGMRCLEHKLQGIESTIGLFHQSIFSRFVIGHVGDGESQE